MAENKKKCRQYSQDYLKFGFIASPTSESIPMCLLCKKTFSNDSMKPSKMKDHLERIYCDKKSKELDYFKALKAKFHSRPRLETFFKSPANPDLQGQKALYNIALYIAKKGKPYCIGEEVILPALEEVLRNVMKTNPDPVLKSVPLSASTVKRQIDEMAHNVEKTLLLELQCSKFSLQLDEATFGSSSVLMAYVRYFSRVSSVLPTSFCSQNI